MSKAVLKMSFGRLGVGLGCIIDLSVFGKIMGLIFGRLVVKTSSVL